MNLIDTIKRLAHEQRDEVIEWRRWMHRHPELSQEEYGTMAFVAERLREMGLEPRTGIGRTGVMPNLSPQDTRALYSIYNNKLSTGSEAAESAAELRARMKAIGYEVPAERGDYSDE